MRSFVYQEDGNENYYIDGRKISNEEGTIMLENGLHFWDCTEYDKLSKLTPDIFDGAPAGLILVSCEGILKYYINGARIHPRSIPVNRRDNIRQYCLIDGAYTFVGMVSLQEKYRSQVNWSSHYDGFSYNNHSNSTFKDNSRESNLTGKSLLDSLSISNKKQWKQWLRVNHPDKNPSIDKELVARVNDGANLYL